MTLTDSFKFNKHNFKISQSKTSLSNDAGSSLIQMFMLKKLNIKQFFRDFLPVSDNRKFYIFQRISFCTSFNFANSRVSC